MKFTVKCCKFLQFLVCCLFLIGQSVKAVANTKDESILIIGAGSSGLAAAAKLYENDFKNIKILEYENRIGGRINTQEFGENVIDLGAQWCHGIENNVVYQLAYPLGYLDDKIDIINFNQTQYIESNGEVFPLELALEQFDYFIGIEQSEELTEFNGTLEDFFVPKYKEFARSTNLSEDVTNEFLHLFELYICGDGAMENWQQQNGINYASFEESAGFKAINWNGNGYKTILDILLKKHSNPTFAGDIMSKIEFNKEVVSVDYNADDKIIVSTKDGQKYDASKVIITISLGVLKERHHKLFEPNLPERKQLAIEKLSFGLVNKIFLEFETKWWPDDWHGFQILWQKNDLKDLEVSNSWLSSLIGVRIVEHQPKTLLAWICGPKTKLYETYSDTIVIHEVMDILRKLLGSKFTMSELKNSKRTKWYSKPNFKGTYSYRSIDSYNFNVTNNDLAEPVKNQNGENVLFFAGEATHNTRYSTVHGAIESGWRAAKQIIEQ